MKILVLILSGLAMINSAQAAEVTLFDASPAHPWNRLYAALFSEASATLQEARTQAQWDAPDERLTSRQFTELLTELDGFLSKHAETLSSSPPRRALLQSALWATFDQVSDPRGVERAPRIEIARRCAEIIRRLALGDAQIAALPDNYAATAKSGIFPADFDAARPTRVFLPPDLLGPDSPWVMLLWSFDGPPAAIRHLEAVQGRSVFYVFIKLPAGREATLKYLRTLAGYPQPYQWNEKYADYPYARSPVQTSPTLPQFPKGTEVALMRRLILPNARGDLVVTPVTQSLQVRVYVKDPRESKVGDPDNQSFLEFRLPPTALIAGHGELVVADRRQPDPLMKFEEPSMFRPGGCNDCHAQAGIYSVNTYTRQFGPPRITPWFEPTTRESQNQKTIQWKQQDFRWGLLQGFLASSPPAVSPR